MKHWQSMKLVIENTFLFLFEYADIACRNLKFMKDTR
jgi:hypothetical protein